MVVVWRVVDFVDFVDFVDCATDTSGDVNGNGNRLCNFLREPVILFYFS